MIFPKGQLPERYITNKLPNVSRCISAMYTDWTWFILASYPGRCEGREKQPGIVCSCMHRYSVYFTDILYYTSMTKGNIFKMSDWDMPHEHTLVHEVRHQHDSFCNANTAYSINLPKHMHHQRNVLDGHKRSGPPRVALFRDIVHLSEHKHIPGKQVYKLA